MKKISPLFLLLPFVSFAQSDPLEWYSKKYAQDPFFMARDSDLVRIRMPRLSETDFYKVFKTGGKSRYLYLVTDDSTFNKIFSKFDRETLPSIDFSKQELLVYIGCPQCAVLCGHSGLKDAPCHRNACRYSDSWFVRAKDKPSLEAPQ